MSKQPPDIRTMPANGTVRLPSILSAMRISAGEWWAGVKSGTYPRPVRSGKTGTAWRVSDVRRIVDQQGAAS